MWNDLHGVYLAHKNSLNGRTSYFYLLKEIEVRDGMGTQVNPALVLLGRLSEIQFLHL